MNLFPELEKVYGREQFSAGQAQKQAEIIAFGPMVFQISRIMLKWGIFEMLRFSKDGLTLDEVVEKTGKSNYAIKILLEASLGIGTVLIDTKTDRYTLSKTGWFLLNDKRNQIDIDFNHDVNYIGLFDLDFACQLSLLLGDPTLCHVRVDVILTIHVSGVDAGFV